MKTKILLFLMVLAVTCNAQQPFDPPELTETNWVNPTTGLRETLAHWDPTNDAPTTIYYCQFGFTNSVPGERIAADWLFPETLYTTQTYDSNRVPVNPQFLMMLPYSPNYVFRLVPMNKSEYLFPSPIHQPTTGTIRAPLPPPPPFEQMVPLFVEVAPDKQIRIMSLDTLPETHPIKRKLKEVTGRKGKKGR